ncbi:dihydrolipoyl dehydrogenase [Mycoplasmopsis columbinasalis]|uniref:Dihydrolipoyl dehydrogenase n=1 Tax=Mycoplasmopsis columbinasalis TaxID=114880 RepID=A0A449B9I7_9BACT|nr:dihydrolipoyl dehydrogenase [Mycoplasmopsis columbinasalis]VEU77825.1 thioredoxin reductase [Mycoplasmopsis columbinasalis]
MSECKECKACNVKIDAEFDVIVVGSGPGGYLAAEEAGKQGLKTLIVEKEFWGGVCLNVGCIPTKTLLKSAEVLETIAHAGEYGVIGNLGDLKIDFEQTWAKMHERKYKVVDQLTKGVQMLMKGSKVATEFGEAKFLSPHVIEVNGKVYKAKNMILAMGSHARKLTMLPGFEKAYEANIALTSKQAINYDSKLPKSIAIVGGGVIGVEFAQVFKTAGAQVTILQNTDSILMGIDKDAIKEMTKVLTSSGVNIIYNAQTKELNANNELVYSVDGVDHTIKADVYLIAVGRIPNSQGLKEVGIEVGARGEVVVDQHMRTNVEGVYAIGDLTGQAMLAHVAYQHAITAVESILGFDTVYKNKPIPGCIYTHPEISFTGLTEEQAKEKGIDAFSAKYSFGFLGKAIAAKATTGFAKLVVDKKDGKILGGHIIGANSTDYIAEITLAIEKGLTVFDLTHTIHPHPTFSEIIWECARAAALKLHLEHKK